MVILGELRFFGEWNHPQKEVLKPSAETWHVKGTQWTKYITWWMWQKVICRDQLVTVNKSLNKREYVSAINKVFNLSFIYI